MFDEPIPNGSGSRLPESPRINSLLAGLMSLNPATNLIDNGINGINAISTEAAEDFKTPGSVPRSGASRTFSEFLGSIQWAYVPARPATIPVSPEMLVREFFAQVNWPGINRNAPETPGALALPPTVESFLTECSWD